jgi:hypothetical protein
MCPSQGKHSINRLSKKNFLLVMASGVNPGYTQGMPWNLQLIANSLYTMHKLNLTLELCKIAMSGPCN